MCCRHLSFFCFNYTATTEIYTLSLHDALPIFHGRLLMKATTTLLALLLSLFLAAAASAQAPKVKLVMKAEAGDRKSTRLNSSHANISYAVFCLKKKKKNKNNKKSQETTNTIWN